LTVSAGAKRETPAFTEITRLMYMSRASPWMTLPITLWPMASPSSPERSMAARAAMVPRSIADTSLSVPPKAPIAVRAALVTTTRSTIVSFFPVWMAHAGP